MKTVLYSLQTILHPYKKVLVAFSGGLDSTVLLHQLVMLRDSLNPELIVRAMHVHHGLSPFADKWLAHCQACCEAWNIPFISQKVQLEAKGQSIEAVAREARYRALIQARLNDEAIITAQHQDDQCETFLLALKRGSGPAGLAAMPESLPFSGTHLIRPLLGQTRHTLEEWADTHQLFWIEDESNEDCRYDRNFLRLTVLPQIQQRWPYFSRSVARSAALCGAQEQLLDELLEEQLQSLLQQDGALLITPLLTMSKVRRDALLRRWFAFLGAQMPSSSALQHLWNDVIMSREDACPHLRFGLYEVRRYRGALYWCCIIDNSVAEDELIWSSPFAPLLLPAGLGQLISGKPGTVVRLPYDNEQVSIRFKAQGTFHIVGRNKGRSLKKLWQELHIPPWQRRRTPLLFYNEQLIAAVGLFVTNEGRPTDTSCWHIKWQKENKK